MKRKFIFPMVIIFICIFNFSFVFANETGVGSTTSSTGNSSSSETNNGTSGSTTGTNNGTSGSTITLSPSTNFDLSGNSTGIYLHSNKDVIPESTVLDTKSITSGNEYDKVKTILGNTVSKMYVYDISLESKGVAIQPNGKVKISIPIPNDVDTSKLIIFRITDNGEKIEYTASLETMNGIKYASFETDHFSTYVLGQKDDGSTKAPGSLPKAGVGISLTIVIIAVIGMSVLSYIKYKHLRDI